MKKTKTKDLEVIESKLPKRKLSKYRAELERIERAQGILTPQAVVLEAASESSPLHKAFDWDDTSASEKYRLFQARYLINTIRVEIMGSETNAFINAVVKIDRVPMRGYISTTRALRKKDVMKQVVASATREIEYWQRKYEAYEELQKIINTNQLSRVRGGE